MERRTFVRGIGAMTVAGALAGCSGGGEEGAGDGGENGSPTGDGSDDSGGGDTSVPSEVDSYLQDNDANLYEGEAVDKTGQDAVEVSVGAGDQGYAFKPPVIRVSTGTEVTWVWTGKGSQHNVKANDGAFESERMSAAGSTFAHTFESAGNYLYHCVPHEALGMHAAVVVE